jgi:hypothetical protein
MALPLAHEETEPAFHHHPAGTLPEIEVTGARVRVLIGSAYGATSPVHTFSPLLYVDITMPAGCELLLPPEHQERASYVAEGAIACGAERAEPGRMLVFAPDAEVRLRAQADSRVMLIGGAPIDGKRHIWWNFVSSSKERIEQAKRDWKDGRYPKVPGDEMECVPLPDWEETHGSPDNALEAQGARLRGLASWRRRSSVAFTISTVSPRDRLARRRSSSLRHDRIEPSTLPPGDEPWYRGTC